MLSRELAIEIESKDGPGALSRFGEVFDAELRTINVDYNTKRTGDLGMAPPVITTLMFNCGRTRHQCVRYHLRRDMCLTAPQSVPGQRCRGFSGDAAHPGE